MTTRSMEAPFGWLTRMGMGLMSFFAQFGDAASGGSSGGYQAQSASRPAGGGYYRKKEDDDATGKRPPFPMPGCCRVRYPDGPFCDYPGSDPSRYTCPEGYYRQWWFCPTEPPPYGACAECTTNKDTCWRGDFLCSTWWYV